MLFSISEKRNQVIAEHQPIRDSREGTNERLYVNKGDAKAWTGKELVRQSKDYIREQMESD